MTSNNQPKKYHKLEILALCQDCPDIHGKGCIITDIEGSRDEYLPLPECMKNRDTYEKLGHQRIKTGTPMKNRDTISNKTPKNTKKTDTKRMCPISTIHMNENETHCPEKTGTSQYVQTQTGKLKLKEIDLDILKLLAEKYHQRKVAKELNKPLATINRRIIRLEKAGLITAHQGVYGTKIYTLSNRCPIFQDKNPTSFIYNETPASDTVITAHSMSFKFPILAGSQPKSSKAFKTKSWTGYVFNFPDYTIRSTPTSIIIDVNVDLGADSINNLILKYTQIAESKTYKFAEKHHVALGGISKNREGHFTIEDNALAQIVTERGEFQTTSGLMFNKSQSSGDLEGNEQQARAIEYSINTLPELAAGMKSNLEDININMDAGLSGIMNSVNDMQTWLILERENRALKELTLKQDEQIELLKQQITQKDELNNLKHLKDRTQTERINHEKDGMYG